MVAPLLSLISSPLRSLTRIVLRAMVPPFVAMTVDPIFLKKKALVAAPRQLPSDHGYRSREGGPVWRRAARPALCGKGSIRLPRALEGFLKFRAGCKCSHAVSGTPGSQAEERAPLRRKKRELRPRFLKTR